jgi:hypothetical protein
MDQGESQGASSGYGEPRGHRAAAGDPGGPREATRGCKSLWGIAGGCKGLQESRRGHEVRKELRRSTRATWGHGEPHRTVSIRRKLQVAAVGHMGPCGAAGSCMGMERVMKGHEGFWEGQGAPKSHRGPCFFYDVSRFYWHSEEFC